MNPNFRLCLAVAIGLGGDLPFAGHRASKPDPEPAASPRASIEPGLQANHFKLGHLGVSLPILRCNKEERLPTGIDINCDGPVRAINAGVSSGDSGRSRVERSLMFPRPNRPMYPLEMLLVSTSCCQYYGAALLNLSEAGSCYRTVEPGYGKLIRTSLSAAAQLNMAVGREVIA